MNEGMSFGEKLRFIRESRRITRTDLCARTGFSRRSIYNWENDLYPPRNYKALETLGVALSVDPAVFLGNFMEKQLKVVCNLV